MLKRLSPYQIAVSVLIIVHLVGLAGLMSTFREWFVLLTPFNLLVSFGILVWFENDKSKIFWWIMLSIMIMGYALEVIGVNTGVPFGEYTYGKAFGIQWKGTPLLIAVNWWIMAYGGATIAKYISNNIYVNSLASGIIITLIDMILEPVAIAYDFWTWESAHVPFQNYVTWTIGIAIFSYFIFRLHPKSKNNLAKWVLGVQVIFFMILLIGLKV